MQLDELNETISEAREEAAQAVRDRDLAQAAAAEAVSHFHESMPGLEAARQKAVHKLKALLDGLQACSSGMPDGILSSIADLNASLKVCMLYAAMLCSYA